MGAKYIAFRIFYMIKTKTGLLKKQFPTNPSFQLFISKDEWLKMNIPFFDFELDRKSFNLSEKEKNALEQKANKIFNNIFTFFSSTEFDLGKNFDWITNPDTGFKYDIQKHWSEIEDFSKQAGDIKYVWEKARFTFIYDIIRYDYHFKKDSSKFIFAQIEDFIDKNPVNQGPNYKCSQEISLRILNWTFALFFYKNSKRLTDELFRKIINSTYWQLHHIYNNINFSRIAVRNNHAITETSMLYLSNLLYPFISDTKKWSIEGKKWLEQEIKYQIYDDGSYLQFSHNYHRVVIQMLTYVLKISELNKISLSKHIIEKLNKTLNFLYNHQDKVSGWLPNYGSNDGALFFPLNSNHYRDFRPQLQVFGLLLGKNFYSNYYEDAFWFGVENKKSEHVNIKILDFKKGGFYGFREDKTLTTVRCGKYNDRPSQADALHLDIWYNGVNVLFDPGTYKYNTEEEYIRFYNGTAGHNTLTISNNDQMLKGERFIWYYWTKYANADITEYDDRFVFSGKIKGFPLLGNNVLHERTVIKYKNKPLWKVIDKTSYKGKLPVQLHWNINPDIKDKVIILAKEKSGKMLNLKTFAGWYSKLYGKKEKFNQLLCTFDGAYCETIIEIK